MAYEAPEPDDLILRYPAFAAVDEDVIQYWLTDAERSVDEGWIEGDYAVALMALAAHNMALAGIGVATGAAALPAGVERFKSGVVDVTLSAAAAAASASGGYSSTRYGREFALLQRRSFAGPRVIAAGTVAA